MCVSGVSVRKYNESVCHVYDLLPDVVPDFIYLDGLDPADAEGSVSGITFKNLRRTVMAADPLLSESTLLPGFYTLVDGRSNNARFLERELKRDYEVHYDPEADVTTFELKEPRFEKKNIYGWEAYGNQE